MWTKSSASLRKRSRNILTGANRVLQNCAMTDIYLIKVLICTLNKPQRISLLSLSPPSTPINPYSHCSPFLTMFPYSRNNCSLRAVLLLTRLSRQFSRTKPLLKRLRTSMGFLSCAMYLSKTRRTLVPPPLPNGQQTNMRETRRQGPFFMEREEMAEEQGWVSRMVHLFRSENLDTQFEVSLTCVPSDNGSILTSWSASPNCPQTFRPWWGKNAVYVPCFDHVVYKVMQTV